MKHPLRKTKTYGISRWDNDNTKVPVLFNYNGNKMWITFTETEGGSIYKESVYMGIMGYCSESFVLPEIVDILYKYWNWRS